MPASRMQSESVNKAISRLATTNNNVTNVNSSNLRTKYSSKSRWWMEKVSWVRAACVDWTKYSSEFWLASRRGDWPSRAVCRACTHTANYLPASPSDRSGFGAITWINREMKKFERTSTKFSSFFSSSITICPIRPCLKNFWFVCYIGYMDTHLKY